jgi:hypothetical protein
MWGQDRRPTWWGFIYGMEGIDGYVWAFEFQNSKLTSVDVDLDVWTTELGLLRICLKSLKVNIEDEDFVMQLINNLPMEYDYFVEAVKVDMNKGLDDQVTVKRGQKRIRARFKRHNFCGKYGHKKQNWKENQNKPNKKSYKGHNRISRNSKSYNEQSKYSKVLFCHFCKKEGHTEPFCFLKQQKQRQNQQGHGSDVVLITKNIVTNLTATYDECLWIADSGATLHATNSLSGMFDLQPCKVNITVRDGKLFNLYFSQFKHFMHPFLIIFWTIWKHHFHHFFCY